MKNLTCALLLGLLGACQVELDHQNKVTWDAPAPARLNAVDHQVAYETTDEKVASAAYVSKFETARDYLNEGRALYDRTCSVCHGRDGHGQGIAVRHGGAQPPDLITEENRRLPYGSFVKIIQDGKDEMKSMRAQLTVEESRAVARYLHVLISSQRTPVQLLPSDVRKKLGAPP